MSVIHVFRFSQVKLYKNIFYKDTGRIWCVCVCVCADNRDTSFSRTCPPNTLPLLHFQLTPHFSSGIFFCFTFLFPHNYLCSFPETKISYFVANTFFTDSESHVDSFLLTGLVQLPWNQTHSQFFSPWHSNNFTGGK